MQTSYFNVSNLSILNLLRGEKFPVQGGKFNLSTQAIPEPGKCFCVQVTNFPVNEKDRNEYVMIHEKKKKLLKKGHKVIET